MVCFKSCFTAFKHRKRNQYPVPDASSPSSHPRDIPSHGGTRLLEIEIPTEEPIIPEQPINHHVSPESNNALLGEKFVEEARASCNVVLVKKATFEIKVEEETQVSLLKLLLSAKEVGDMEKIGGEIEERLNGGELEANVVAPRSLNQEQVENGDEGGSYGRVIEESSESLFSISIGRNHKADLGEKEEEEITSPLPKCNPSHRALGSENASVLHPVEETTALFKSAGKATRQQQQQHCQEDKENVNMEINIESCPSPPEFSFNPLIKKPQQRSNKNKEKDQDDDVAADASLSNWPKDSGDHSSAGYLPNKSKEDKKQVFGALTIGVLEKVDATSPANSRSQRFGGTPALGTVGSYWRHSGGDVQL